MNIGSHRTMERIGGMESHLPEIWCISYHYCLTGNFDPCFLANKKLILAQVPEISCSADDAGTVTLNK